MRDTTVPEALLRAHRRATRLQIVGQSSIQRWWIAGTTDGESPLNCVNVIRNTPLTLILVFCSLGILYILQVSLADEQSPTSIVDNNIRWAIVGLAVYHSAFVCEALRSGVNTVPAGQAEAARSIGLTFAVVSIAMGWRAGKDGEHLAWLGALFGSIGIGLAMPP